MWWSKKTTGCNMRERDGGWIEAEKALEDQVSMSIVMDYPFSIKSFKLLQTEFHSTTLWSMSGFY